MQETPDQPYRGKFQGNGCPACLQSKGPQWYRITRKGQYHCVSRTRDIIKIHQLRKKGSWKLQENKRQYNKVMAQTEMSKGWYGFSK